MKSFFIEKLYDGERWHKNVLLKVNKKGLIESVEQDSDSSFDNTFQLVIPGFHNAHSHAFQRAMAGWCEKKQMQQDSFWSWRTQMYNLAGKITPEINRKICQWLYIECLESGFTSHCEFHYLHKPHCSSEKNKDQLSAALEMANSVIESAKRVKMPLCLMPVLYQQSEPYKPCTELQKPFVFKDVENYFELVDSIKDVNLALSLHSLRAVKEESFSILSEYLDQPDSQEYPIHIHISEQPLEVAQIESAYGARPLEYLSSRIPLDSRWNLVHATHFNAIELGIAIQNRCNIVLCPITEANLGDGVFNLSSFYDAGGSFTIGSDSNVMIDPFQELAILEYGQRLKSGQRISISDSINGSCAEALISRVQKSAEASYGGKLGLLKKGYLANFLCLNNNHPSLLEVDEARLLDAIVFAAGKSCLTDVYVKGDCLVKDGKHKIRDETFLEYKECIKSLRSVV